jgi:hypothetical protein
MDIRKVFGTDKKSEIEGTWIDIGKGVRIKVARIGNPENSKLAQKLWRPYRAAHRANSLPDEVADELMIEAIARTILVGWEGVEADGKPLPYSYENAKALLSEVPDFRQLVWGFANEAATFRREQEEAEQKN